MDSPLRGLERYEGAPTDEIRGAVRRALVNLSDLAVRENIAFVLIAGDIYDGTWKDHNTGLYFVQWLDGLQKAGVSVHAISGNHDAASEMTKTLILPANPDGTPVMMSSHECQTVMLEHCNVAIHGRGFAAKAEAENLVREYPSAIPGVFNIGMLHTSLNGAEGHDTYAPCSTADLTERGYQYWALGHVHTRSDSVRDGHTPIVFPGNIQGRNIREIGAKGCELVTVDHAGRVNIEFKTLDVFRWQVCDVDVAVVDEPEQLIDRFQDAMRVLVGDADGLPLGVRVNVVGASEAHDRWLADPETWTQQIRAAAITIAETSVWIEKVSFRTRPLKTVSTEDMESGAIGELKRYFDDLDVDDALLDDVSEELSDLRRKLTAEMSDGNDEVAPIHRADLRAVVREVQPLLMQRLSLGSQARS